MAQEKFLLNGEFIKLDALLKATGLAPSGGVAKEMIQSGDVTVNGEKETRRGAKLRGGEVVSVQGSGREILVEAAARFSSKPPRPDLQAFSGYSAVPGGESFRPGTSEARPQRQSFSDAYSLSAVRGTSRGLPVP